MPSNYLHNKITRLCTICKPYKERDSRNGVILTVMQPLSKTRDSTNSASCKDPNRFKISAAKEPYRLGKQAAVSKPSNAYQGWRHPQSVPGPVLSRFKIE